MTLQIRKYRPGDADLISAFNARLGPNTEFRLPIDPDALGMPAALNRRMYHDLFVAEDNGIVRGGYALKHEHAFAESVDDEIGNFQIPLSEGIVDRRFAAVGIRLLQDAIARQPRLYCLGMGSLSRPLPRMLSRFGWAVETVPFFFLVIKWPPFLKNIEALRRTRVRRIALEFLRVSGGAALCMAGWRTVTMLRRRTRRAAPLRAVEVPIFSEWADSVFERTLGGYAWLIDRSAPALNTRYGPHDVRLIRLRVESGSGTIGWLLLARSQLRGHRQFGDMRLGTIVDGLCSPSDAASLVRVAVERLREEDVDLIVSNQAHAAWCSALQDDGFMRGPSNFIFGRSPALARATGDLAACHINRGDGDGPINL